MKVQARRHRLVEIVRQREKASVEELARALGASKETIRRDLAQLARLGKVQKVHGGATIPRLTGEGPFQQRLSERVEAKARIARAAAALFRPGETLLIDTGTTTLHFAEALAATSGLTVATNSTEIARTLAKADCQVFLLGGAYGAENSQTVGAMVTAQLAAFRAHHAVLTIGALDSRTGAMDYNFQEAEVAQAMAAQAERLTVLADSSKFSALATFAVCPLARIDTLVTDSRPAGPLAQALQKAGVRVVVAAPDSFRPLPRGASL